MRLHCIGTQFACMSFALNPRNIRTKMLVNFDRTVIRTALYIRLHLPYWHIVREKSNTLRDVCLYQRVNSISRGERGHENCVILYATYGQTILMLASVYSGCG